MIRQRGMSSLLMVLLLLTLGSLLLEGLNLQQRVLLAQTASETQAIRDTAIAHSALQWGKQQVWSAQVALACREQAPQGWRACLRIFGDGSLVLSSASGEVQVWQSGEVRGGQVRFFRPRLERFLPAQRGELMSNALKRQRGFSLPETVLAMALMVLTVTALGGYQRGMAQGIVQLNQTRQLWRDAWRYSQLSAPPSPARGQVSRMQTSRQRCVSITVTISRPVAKRVQMTRLHCPVSQ